MNDEEDLFNNIDQLNSIINNDRYRSNTINSLISIEKEENQLFSYYLDNIQKPGWTDKQRKQLNDIILLEIENNKYEDNNTINIDWEDVSNKLKRVHTARECFIQYRNIDDSEINSSKWSPEEEKNLLELVKKYNNLNWQAISKEIQNNRTPWQCLVHYQSTLNMNMVNTSEWSEEEDMTLKQAVQLYGQKNWQHIANTLPGRSSQQCILRYNRSTDCKEGIIGGRWIEEEERRLFLAAIAFELIPSSTSSTLLSTSISSNSSSNGNDKRGYYLKVAKVVETKDSNRCREKWVNYLDPTIKNGNFSIEEDEKLRSLVEQYGPKNWSKLAKLLPGRIDRSLMNRWKTLADKKEVSKQLNIAKKRKLLVPPITGRHNANSIDYNDMVPILKVTKIEKE